MTWGGAIALVVAAGVLGGGCGDDDAPSCPNDLPAACPSPPPSFADEVGAIIVSKCGPCHFEDGVAYPRHDFTTYDDVYRRRSAMLNQVYACTMPPPEDGALSARERQALLAWFVCGAPDN